jgi:RNA polymerase sigma-70 factor (ECF subfamily)
MTGSEDEVTKQTFEATYQEIFRQHYSNLLFYAIRLVGGDEAEDVVQDAFIELWKRNGVIEDSDHIRSFLYRTVYTRSLNVLKHRHIAGNYATAVEEIEHMRVLHYEPGHNDVVEQIENKELRSQIKEAIDALPTKCREVFKLSYLHDMKNKDIADITGISLRTVEAHIHKALKLLRNKLAQHL